MLNGRLVACGRRLLCRTAILGVALLPIDRPCAGPIITADSATILVGPVQMGEAEFVRAAFSLRNPGDSTLHISEVRPGCRCTVTEYDSVIPPGSVGRLLQVVDIHGFSDGPFRRDVVVVSDAAGQPRLTLGVEGIIRSVVEIETRLLRIPVGGHGQNSPAVTLRSEKHDLEITEAVFTADPEAIPAWQPAYPLPLTWWLAPYGDRMGLTYYQMRLWVDFPLTAIPPPGFCLLRINHPRYSQIVCRAEIGEFVRLPAPLKPAE